MSKDDDPLSFMVSGKIIYFNGESKIKINDNNRFKIMKEIFMVAIVDILYKVKPPSYVNAFKALHDFAKTKTVSVKSSSPLPKGAFVKRVYPMFTFMEESSRIDWVLMTNKELCC